LLQYIFFFYAQIRYKSVRGRFKKMTS